MLKQLERFVVHDKVKLIFDHMRNLLMCTLLLAAGHFQLKHPAGIFADSTLQRYLGYGVVGVAVALILLNLLDGMCQLNKLRHPVFLKICLIIVYVVVAIRVVVVTSSFRVS